MGALTSLVLFGSNFENVLNVWSLVRVRTYALVNQSSKVNGIDVSGNRRVVAVCNLLTQRVQIHFVAIKRTVQRRHLKYNKPMSSRVVLTL